MLPMSAEPNATSTQGPQPAASSTRTYVLVILTLIYVLNMIDRKILTILQEPIKREFHLADWQLGLMTGFSFALLYAVAGVPIARFADRASVRRVDVISVALVVWSGATALGGAVQNFTQMLLSRFAVGIGEAGSGPPSQSLIADHYAPHERGKAMGVFALASPIGVAVGMSVGGYIADLFSWRVALLIVGLPGVLLAILFRLTVREPQRGMSEGRKGVIAHVPFVTVVKTIAKKRTFLCLVSGGCLAAFTNLGLQYWFPSFFMRSFGLSLGEVGVVWGFGSGAAGFIGTFGGGWLADKFGKKSPRGILLVPAIGMAIGMPFHIAAVLSGEWHTALILLIIPQMAAGLWIAPNMVLNQGLAPIAMRATIVAISTFLINIVGLGLGPTILGGVSDLFTASTGSSELGLRYALVAIAPVYLLSAFFFFLGSFFVAQDLEYRRAEEAAEAN